VGSIPITRSTSLSGHGVARVSAPARTANLPARSIADVREPDFERECAALYSSTLPYHNFQHVQTVLRSADRLLAACAIEGIPVDVRVVYYAVLLHDAGYHEAHQSLGYDTKEAYSAALARRVLAAREIDPATIAAVEQAIMATLRDAQCVAAEDAVVRMADLAGIGADFAEFLRNTVSIRAELALMTGAVAPWSAWCLRTREVLEGYLAGDIRLTREFDRAQPGNFFARGEANLARLLVEPEPV
jgi:predicted metal-dependent HD superfamily phosphohydrolase